MAQHLAKHGAPVIPMHPDIPPGPHEHLGYPINFWRFVTRIDEEPEPEIVGRTLFHCHEILAAFPGPLPALAIVTETLGMMGMLAERKLFSADTLELLHHHLTKSLEVLAGFPQQPLHGDAHLGNVLGGPLWNDWEDTCLGPVGWDAACLLAGRYGRERQEAAYAASRMGLDPGELELWIEARSLQLSVWRYVMAGTAFPSGSAGVEGDTNK